MIQLADFLGVWRLERHISDHRAGLEGRFLGEASWTARETGVWQAESGVLEFGTGAPMRAERRYLWSELAGRLIVQFDDGRPFHSFDPNQNSSEAEHLCGEDLYQVAYGFANWPQWSSTWRVIGPRKDLVIASRFSPIKIFA